jgi:uncharacterized protein (TIGR02145 family)
LTTGAWCWYQNDSATYWQYGKLYNWYAVNDVRGLAPSGWHIPSHSEWNRLVKCIDANADTLNSTSGIQSTTAGGAMKETGFTHWIVTNAGANNTIGFTGLPGGNRFKTVNGIFEFSSVKNTGFWWSSTQVMPTTAFYRLLTYSNAEVSMGQDNKKNGFSVRIVRD